MQNPNPQKNKEPPDLDFELIKQLKYLAEKREYQKYLDLLHENLKKVRIEECDEKLLYLPKHLHKKIAINLVDLKLDFDYKDEDRLFLRKSVVEKLNRAQNSLPEGYCLMIRDALRTEKIVWGLYKKYFNAIKIQKPELTNEEIDLWLRNILAMPDDQVTPGHMTGGAIDVVLADKYGNRIQMEEDPKIIPKEEQASTFHPELPENILAERKILYNALTEMGFHNFSREYWHYSYGDAYWAVRRKNKTAIYGIPKKEINKKQKN